MIQDEGTSTTSIGVTPAFHLSHGRVTDVYPTRRHIFSPLISLPDRSVLQHTWAFADVLFEPDKLDLSDENARSFANGDALALRVAARAGVFRKAFFEEPNETSSAHLSRICDELETLLDSVGIDERKVQSFLEDGDHRYILCPDAQMVFPRRTIGGERYEPDFVCHRADGDYHFIEIENPSTPIYQRRGEEQSAHLTHAMSQVQDWLRYADDNRDSVRREDGLGTIYKPSGEVIAGRDSDLTDLAQRRFDFARKENARILVRTYDMLLADVRTTAKNLSHFGTSSGRV